MTVFEDRRQAGAVLGARLASFGLQDVVALALPRGGVPVAAEIARRLGCPWDMVFIKKVGAPSNEEFAIGAVSESGVQWRRQEVEELGLPINELQRLASVKQEELNAQLSKWRKGRPAPDVKGQTVIVVDDGLATGATMASALSFLRAKRPRRLIVAVPVASTAAIEAVRDLCDEVVALETPAPFFAVGQWYRDFTQVTDQEVTALLSGRAIGIHSVRIPCGGLSFDGELKIPAKAQGLIVFAHGSGSTHKSPRNRKVAAALNQAGFATLLFDLLTPEEAANRANVFNVPLLVERLLNATGWAMGQEELKGLSIGYFGASTGAAAALGAAAGNPLVRAVVSRGGRPDLAEGYFKDVQAPVLLIVGGEDHGVIKLNERAQAGLPRSEMVTVAGAGHLFEEGATMNEVVDYALNWFKETLSATSPAPRPRPQVMADVGKSLEPLTASGIERLVQALAGARVVMLGEATHGTEEFYEVRRLLSQRLIEDHGFNFIAVEGDWPDCYKLNRYVRTGGGESARLVMEQFRRWPTWMWANRQTESLIEWMRGRSAGFYGLDIYSLFDSLDLVKEYAGRMAPELRRKILEAHSCFESFDRDEIAYSRALARQAGGCAAQALEALRGMLRLRLEDTSLKDEELFDARQNAQIVRDGERYYRAVVEGESVSWNIRDEHMMDTLTALLNKHGEGAKAVVWAHNTHIGDYHATDMREAGYINLGGLARERIGMENVKLVGFGTYEGEVLAGRAWDARAETMRLPPAAEGSFEDFFHRASVESGLDRFHLCTKGVSSLAIRRGHRAVGVVYQPAFEPGGRNYVPTDLAARYDHFVFIDKTSALEALGGARDIGLLPETWPAGV